MNYDIVARSLAKTSLLFEDVLVWMDDCPIDTSLLSLYDKALIECYVILKLSVKTKCRDRT